MRPLQVAALTAVLGCSLATGNQAPGAGSSIAAETIPDDLATPELMRVYVRFRVDLPVLRPVHEVIDRLGRGRVINNRRWIGVNPPRAPGSGEYAVFVIDAVAAANAERCDYGSYLYKCRVLQKLLNENCVAATENAVACEARFLARIRIMANAALMAGLSGSQPDSAAAVPQTFVTFATALRNPNRLAIAAALDASMTPRLNAMGLATRRDSVEAGYVSFLVLHEFAHLQLGHAGGAIPVCAVADAQAFKGMAVASLQQEQAADRLSLDWMPVPVSTGNSGYFAPNFFQTFHTLLLAEAFARANVNFAGRSHSANDLELVATIFKSLGCATSHPFFTERVRTYLRSPKYAGVTYALDSREVVEQAELSVQFCSSMR